MVALLGLLAVFAVVATVVDRLDEEPVTVVQSASADGGADDGGPEPVDVPSDQLTGDYLVSGSSTVYPIVLRQAEAFQEIAPGVAIAVEGPGSGDGAQKFCNGEVPIANASRVYKDEEIEICEANGIEYIEIRRGIDGISVITSPENDAIECVSFNDLYALMSQEATGFERWSDANTLTSAWGGTALPDVDLDVFGPGEESGTYDSFGEIVIESVAKGKTGLDVDSREFTRELRPDYTSSPDDNIILEGIGASRHSLGWVGYAFASEAAEAGRAKLLSVSFEDDGPCVTPTPETIAAADFPIARFLYTYVSADAAENDPSVAAFVDYMLSEEGLQAVSAVGYIDLAPPDRIRAESLWVNRVTGPAWE